MVERPRMDAHAKCRWANRAGNFQITSERPRAGHIQQNTRDTREKQIVKRSLGIIVAVALLLAGSHQLLAPISEIPEKTPAPTNAKRSAKPATTAAPKETSSMNSQTVHVVFTENTRASLVALRTHVEMYEKIPFAGRSDVHPDEITERLRQVLSTRFRNVSISNDDSGGRGGLVMLFDLQTHVGMSSGDKNNVSFVATFKDGNGRAIRTIAAAGTSTVPYPAFGTRFPAALNAAFTDFSQKFSGL
jgi:hypothetical protein